MHDATPTSADLRDEGVTLAASGDQPWQERAVQWISALPYGTEFTSEDLTDAIGNPSNDHRAVGAAMLVHSRAGSIVTTGRFDRSARPSRHAGIIQVWVRA